MHTSIVVRTLNEAVHLDDLLNGVKAQENLDHEPEVVIVDSGSTDATLEIAEAHACNIQHIDKREFSFGRSLNMGCAAASGDILIFVSGHCVPASTTWLAELIEPIVAGRAEYTYGKQIGAEQTKYSEIQLFQKYYPDASNDPQDGFFCNNANSALLKDVWDEYRFNEVLTGLEDMELAKRIVDDGKKISYIAEAPVYHLHDENWKVVRNRYERESIALQKIMPEVHVGKRDLVRYIISGVLHDLGSAVSERRAARTIGEIIMFRFMQYWGTYRGNHEHRRLSRQMKEKYFYPR